MARLPRPYVTSAEYIAKVENGERHPSVEWRDAAFEALELLANEREVRPSFGRRDHFVAAVLYDYDS